MNRQRASRRTLLLIGLCFAAPILISMLLTRAGWMPSGRKNYGTLLSPPLALKNSQLADGQAFAWKTPEWYWTLVVRVPGDCNAQCRARLELVANLREALARDATKLRIAIADTLPQGASLGGERGVYRLAQPVAEDLDAAVARPEAEPRLALVDPNGYVILLYPDAADYSKVRKDLAKLLK